MDMDKDTSVTENLKIRLKIFTALFIAVYLLCYPQIYKYLPQHMKVKVITYLKKCCIIICSNGSFTTFLEIFYVCEVQKKNNHLSYFSFKIFHFVTIHIYQRL